MTKRLTAWALALLLIVACFAFTACKDDNAENSSEASETSVPDAAPLTPKEMYVNALKNTYTYLTATDKLDGDAFNFNGLLTVDKESNQKIEFDVTADIKNKLFSGDVALCADDEKAIINLLGNENAVYADIKDVTELPVKSDINGLPAEEQEEINELINKAQVVLNIIAGVCDDDVVNDLYKTETGDVTIDGVEYKDETLVTFELDNEKLEAIGEVIKTKINENEDAKAFIEEIKEMLEGESDEEAGGLYEFIENIKFTVSSKMTAVIREDKIAASEKETSCEVEVAGTKVTASIKETQNGNNAKGEISVLVPYNSEDDIDDSIATDTKLSVPYTIVYGDNGFTVSISELVMEQGMKVTIPCDITIAAEFDENAVKLAIKAKMEMQGEGFDIELSLAASKCDAPEVKIPEEFITEEEIDSDILEAFVEKYPKVAEAYGLVFAAPDYDFSGFEDEYIFQ